MLLLDAFTIGSLKIQNLFSQYPKNIFESALRLFFSCDMCQYFVVWLLTDSVSRNPSFNSYGWYLKVIGSRIIQALQTTHPLNIHTHSLNVHNLYK